MQDPTEQFSAAAYEAPVHSKEIGELRRFVWLARANFANRLSEAALRCCRSLFGSRSFAPNFQVITFSLRLPIRLYGETRRL